MTPLFWAALAAIGNVIGALVLVRQASRSIRFLEGSVAFGAGFMLAVTPVAGMTALLGLLLHTFFDGVAIASGFAVSKELGLLLFAAVLVHKLPEGLTVASLMLAGGQSRPRALGAAALLGVATIVGVLMTELFRPLAQHGLALAAGVTLYVAASNLVPEFQGKKTRTSSALAFFGGVAVFWVTRVALGQ